MAIKIENTNIYGWEASIRGMRNPLNSWDKCDTDFNSMRMFHLKNGETISAPIIGNNDLDLMTRLAKAGRDHGKFLRMITVTFDVTAPLYHWKEIDTYKISTVCNSCSTMHKIQAKEFTLEDFSYEYLFDDSREILMETIKMLNKYRDIFNESKGKDKDSWWQMIQLLPSSYNQRRTLQFNYETLRSLYPSRKGHKLDEWHYFCNWILSLPYINEICGLENN